MKRLKEETDMAKAPHGFGFDGLSNILAHAFYPPSCGVSNAGDLHFDLYVRKRGAGDGGHMGLPRFLDVVGRTHRVPDRGRSAVLRDGQEF